MTAKLAVKPLTSAEYKALEVDFLLGTDHPHNIAARLGVGYDSLLRTLRGAGKRPDLADRLTAEMIERTDHKAPVRRSCDVAHR